MGNLACWEREESGKKEKKKIIEKDIKQPKQQERTIKKSNAMQIQQCKRSMQQNQELLRNSKKQYADQIIVSNKDGLTQKTRRLQNELIEKINKIQELETIQKNLQRQLNQTIKRQSLTNKQTKIDIGQIQKLQKRCEQLTKQLTVQRQKQIESKAKDFDIEQHIQCQNLLKNEINLLKQGLSCLQIRQSKELQDKDNQLRLAKDKQQKYQNQVTTFKSNIERLESEINKFKDYKSQKQNLEEQIQRLKNHINQKQEMIRLSDYQRDLGALTQQKKYLQSQLKLKEQKMVRLSDYQRDVDALTEQKAHLQSQLRLKEQKMVRLSDYQRDVDALTEQKAHLQSQLRLKEQKMVRRSHYQRGLDALTQQKQYLQSQLKLKDQALLKLKASSGSQHLFSHQILEDNQDAKSYLIKCVEGRVKMRIKKTKLVFKFDMLNKTNLHQYIDRHQNLVVIVQVYNGHILAGYSEGSFYPKMASNKDALIMSLTNQKSFELVEKNRRGIVYDDYYLIMGNSQIRIKSLQKKIFSNFGISNGYYASKGEKVNILLGCGIDREVEIKGYQIYELFYDE